MKPRLNDDELMGIGIGAIAAVVIGALMAGLRDELHQANGALVLVLVVILAAYTGGRRAGVATALVAAASFDFFLTRPYNSLAIASRDDIIITILLVAVGLAVGQIASSRSEAKVAGKAGTDAVAALYRVSRLTAEGAEPPTVVAAVEAEISAILHLSSCHFSTLPLDPPLAELDSSGHVDAPFVFAGDGFVLPADGVTIAVRDDHQIYGWLVCRGADVKVGLDRDHRRTAVVLADHLALTLALKDHRTAAPDPGSI